MVRGIAVEVGPPPVLPFFLVVYSLSLRVCAEERFFFRENCMEAMRIGPRSFLRPVMTSSMHAYLCHLAVPSGGIGTNPAREEPSC